MPFGGKVVNITRGKKSNEEILTSCYKRKVKTIFKKLINSVNLKLNLKFTELINGEYSFTMYDLSRIYLDESLLKNKKFYSIIAILAHEVGHFVIYNNRIKYKNKRSLEKQADIMGACILREIGLSPKLLLNDLFDESLKEKNHISNDPNSYPSFQERYETLKRFIKSYWKGEDII